MKKLWNIILTEIPIIAEAPKTLNKSLEKGFSELTIRKIIETMQIRALQKKQPLSCSVKTCNDNNNNRTQQISTEGVLDKTRQGGQGDQLRDVQEI